MLNSTVGYKIRPWYHWKDLCG